LNVIDAEIYECDVIVIPQDTTYISTATTSNSRAISVSGTYGISGIHVQECTCIKIPL
jgi:hypothetical protein